MQAKAFLSCWLGPTQAFIEAARTVRDLWTGSFLLAWLTRAAMQPVIDHPACGPQVIVSPDMSHHQVSSGAADLHSPCLPNRFLAEVPMDAAGKLADRCRAAFAAAWLEICNAVHAKLSDRLQHDLPDWYGPWTGWASRLWNAQLGSFFDLRVVVLPLADCDDRVIVDLLDPQRRAQGGTADDRRWSDCAEVLGGLLSAQKAVRQVSQYQAPPDPDGQYPGKCSLLGTYEQMGPARLAEAAKFWSELADGVSLGGTHVRKRERLCSISLVKRFAWPAYLADKMEANPRAMRFEDTATVAAVEWLDAPSDGGSPPLDPDEVRGRHRSGWSGQWLHWSRPDQDKDEPPCPEEVWRCIEKKRRSQGKPPTYYAILMLDGDHMGDRLRERPGAEHQRAVSHTLSKFALNQARRIVEDEHHGSLIYCGGDDLLALLPTARAMACARRIQQKFAEHWQRELPGLAAAEVTAGLAVVHYKEDLRFSLDTARRAEKQGKKSGRNTLVITACRRSGQHASALCPWDFADTVDAWVRAFLPETGQPGASDRWAYHLCAELPTLAGIPRDAMRSEIRRQIARTDALTRGRMGHGNPDAAGELLTEAFDRYCGLVEPRGFDDAQALEGFLGLGQTASFLARGRDE